MRLIVAVERYAPHIGGAEYVAERIAGYLNNVGHDVIVVTSGGSRSSETIRGVSVERFPLRGNFAKGISGPVDAPLHYIESWRPDAILCYAAQTWTSDLAWQLLPRGERPAIVLAPCGFSGLDSPAYRSYFKQMRSMLPLYDALIFHSSIYRDWEFAVRAGAQRLAVIPNGADACHFKGQLRMSLRPGERLLVTVGSHVRSKGHDIFVRAAGELGKRFGVQAVIVSPARHGVDALRGCYPRCLVSAHMGRVRLVEGSDRAVALDAIASADLFLLPSAVECSPLVVLESMAAGVPWVSFDAGNVRELAGGIVVETAQDLVRAASEILNGDNPNLGEAGRRKWERDHRWEALLPRYGDVLSDAVARRRAIAPAIAIA